MNPETKSILFPMALSTLAVVLGVALAVLAAQIDLQLNILLTADSAGVEAPAAVRSIPHS